MNKILFLFILFLLVSNSLVCQNQDWQPVSGNENSSSPFLMKQEENIFYISDTVFIAADRDNIILKTKEYIARDLDILHESEYNEPVLISFVPDRAKLHKLTGKRDVSYTLLKDQNTPLNSIGCVYDAEYCTLNKELMNLIVNQKWGIQKDGQLFWLKVGLATYATPEADSCDGYTLEERYVYFLQHNKLLDVTQFPSKGEMPQYKIACNESAYIVEYLLNNHGIEKLKLLWQDSMDGFDKIYGMKFKDIIVEINAKLYKKYPNLINFDWEAFNGYCIDPQRDDWLSAYNPLHLFNSELDKMVTKEDGNLKFTLYSEVSIAERNDIIAKTKEYIADNLSLINESQFNDSIHILLVRNRDDMEKLIGGRIGGTAFLKDEYISENLIQCVYGPKHSPLKHELMHMVNMLKWGINSANLMLTEGLAVFADSDTEDCDGHTLEERYAYFLQSKKLLDIRIFPDANKMPEGKIAYNQSGYVVGYLFENFGVDKIKMLWQSGMGEFENIYGMTFDDMISKINDEVSKKYPNPIDFNWDDFNKNCIE